MYIPPPQRPVRLHSSDGHSWEFSSLEAFVEAYGLSWIRGAVGPAFRVHLPDLFDRTYPYVLRDCDDRVLTADDCYFAWRRSSATWRSAAHCRRYAAWNGRGPVPGTGKTPAGGRYFRAPKTQGAHRAACGVLSSEGEPKFRGARNYHNLPSAYDDRPIIARADRSWKRFRRTRWRARE